MMTVMRRRGFSLLEVLAVVAILGTVLAMLSRQNPRSSGNEARLAAETMAEELRGLRRRAIANSRPTALVVPRTGVGYATLYYALEGYGKPALLRTRRLDSEYPSVRVSTGSWASMAPAVTAGKKLNLDLWEAPRPGDLTVAFDANGELVSNLPRHDGSIFLIVCGNSVAANLDIGGLTYPHLNAAYDPYTLRIDASGTTHLMSGAPAEHGLALMPAGAAAGHHGDAPAALGVPSEAPTIEPIELLPVPPPNLPAGVDASVRVGSYLKLKVRASDSDGGPLYINFDVRRPAAPSGALGALSYKQKVPMEWKGDAWEAVWEWIPPTDAGHAEIFDLQCSVEDRFGQVATRMVGTQGKIMALRDGRIVYSDNATGHLFSMNSDGSENRQLTTQGYNTFACGSPDGTSIAYISTANGSPEIWTMTRDGAEHTQLTDRTAFADPYDWLEAIVWSPDGTRIAFKGRVNGGVAEDVYIMDADGGNVVRVATDLPARTGATNTFNWWFDGATYQRNDLSSQYLLFFVEPTWEVLKIPLDQVDNTSPPVIHSGIIGGALSPDGTKVAALMGGIHLFDFDGNTLSHVGQLTNGSDWGPGWAPNSQRIFFTRALSGTDTAAFVTDIVGSPATQISHGEAGESPDTWIPGGSPYDP